MTTLRSDFGFDAASVRVAGAFLIRALLTVGQRQHSLFEA